MRIQEITGAVISPNAENRKALTYQLGSTGTVKVRAESDYCATQNDLALRRLVELSPDVVLIDMQEADQAIATLKAIRQFLPSAWLLVVSELTDSQSIIEAVRAGAREFLPAPIAPETLSDALRRYMEHSVRLSETGEKGRIYSVISAKGGSGTTSVAINLATTLSFYPEARVGLVDVNAPIGDVAAYLNLRPQYTLSDALEAGSRLDSTLLESYMSRAHGIGILPGVPGLRQSPGEGKVDWQRLSHVLDLFSHSYSYTVLDVPSWMEREQLDLLTHFSSSIVVLLTPELPALWRTDRLLRLFESAYGSEKVRLVVNRSTKRDEITTKEIEKVLRHPVFHRLPNNYPVAIQAVNTGTPLVTVNHSSLAQAYVAFAEKLTGRGQSNKRRSFLGLFAR